MMLDCKRTYNYFTNLNLYESEKNLLIYENLPDFEISLTGYGSFAQTNRQTVTEFANYSV